MRKYTDVYKGEEPPKRKDVLWAHHSVKDDLTSPVVVQIFSKGKWVDAYEGGGAEVERLSEELGDITDLKTTDKDSTVDAINEVVDNVGDLNDLTTTVKTDLVSAINEASTKGDPASLLYTAQSLTEAQKTQALTNIGAASQQEFESLSAGEVVPVTELPNASDDTMGKIYLVGPDENDEYDRYISSYNGTNYSWVQVGTTQMDLSGYATDAEVSQIQQEVTDDISQLEAEVNGISRDIEIPATYVNGYIATNGVIGATGSSATKHTEAIELTEAMTSLKCYSLTGNALAGGVGFYKSLPLPASTAQATRTVEVVGIGTTTGSGNTLVEISQEKLAQLKAAGAKYFSVCVDDTGTKGISYFVHVRGIVDDLSDLNDKVDSYDAEIESIENGVIQETEQPSTVFEYGYITTDGKFPNPGSGTTFSRTSPIEIGNIIGIRAMAMLNSTDGGGVFFFKTNAKPPTTANADLVGVIGGHTTTTAGYVNDEITITREQIRQMQAQGAKYFAVSSYTDGAKLYTSVDAQDGLLQINEKIATLENVTETCRKRIDITLQDTQDEILAKLIKAYDGEDYDVFWECGTYQFNTVWVTMRTMNRFNSIGTWEMPIGGKNNRYFFNGSIIIGSGIYDLIGSYCQNSNLFGTLRKGNHTYDLYDATFIISDGNYCFHDETSSEPGYNVHRYHNIKFINQPTEHSAWIRTGLGIGNGQNTTIILDGCYAGCTDGEPGIRNHGMEHESGETPLESHSRFVFKNCYFANGVQLGNLDQNENCDVIVSGCSYTSFVISEGGQGVYTTYFYCNEVRS